MADRLGVTTAGADVVENPLLMADFLLDVLGHGLAHPFVVAVQPGTAGHQQRHGVTHVMEGLGQKRDVAVALYLAAQGGLDQW